MSSVFVYLYIELMPLFRIKLYISRRGADTLSSNSFIFRLLAFLLNPCPPVCPP